MTPGIRQQREGAARRGRGEVSTGRNMKRIKRMESRRGPFGRRGFCHGMGAGSVGNANRAAKRPAQKD